MSAGIVFLCTRGDAAALHATVQWLRTHEIEWPLDFQGLRGFQHIIDDSMPNPTVIEFLEGVVEVRRCLHLRLPVCAFSAAGRQQPRRGHRSPDRCLRPAAPEEAQGR